MMISKKHEGRHIMQSPTTRRTAHACGRSGATLGGIMGVAGLLTLGVSPLQAQAATTTTTTFNVSATVQATCSITATSMAFGVYTGALINSTSSLSVTCTNTTAYNIGLDAGTALGATVTTRKMSNGAATVGYGLFRDGGRTSNWGNTVGSDTASGTGNGVVQGVTVYGQMAAGQIAAPGPYSDTITAIVSY